MYMCVCINETCSEYWKWLIYVFPFYLYFSLQPCFYFICWNSIDNFVFWFSWYRGKWLKVSGAIRAKKYSNFYPHLWWNGKKVATWSATLLWRKKYFCNGWEKCPKGISKIVGWTNEYIARGRSKIWAGVFGTCDR